ncbi:aspartyl protease family protein [Stakelama tenebrarum]|uniref:Peptidase A2 domain-containing protein n=1 Tax=Stakelama tenebrarum TaxID=2711215 RepID=A0A6G6Y6N2_9SPHN|nr:retropepsin-like aspartic protease [Sphingosinithalassobacter tenebrarum]QIG80592.1 hypothetical protein G5C33_12910 [Sphingosinithalassobacter tenebrarum]
MAAAAVPDQSIMIPIGIIGRRVVLPLTIGDSETCLFLLDTGATVNLIDHDLAQELRLPVHTGGVMRGIGGRTVNTVYRAPEVVLGGAVRQRNLLFVDIGEDLSLGEDMRGAMSAGLLTTFDSDLDFVDREIRVYPRGRSDRSGFTRLSGEIEHADRSGGSQYMYIDAWLGQARMRFLLDTGAPRALMLFAHAVGRSGLWNDDIPWTPQQMHGLGGEADLGRTVRAPFLEMDGIRFDSPLVQLFHPDDNDSGRDADGIIGLEIMEQLDWSTEVRRNRIWARRNGNRAERQYYGMSGLWVDAEGDDLVAVAVGKGSPAEAAGIAAGDRFPGMTLPQMLARINQREGAEVTLEVTRGGTTTTRSFTLARYLD